MEEPAGGLRIVSADVGLDDALALIFLHHLGAAPDAVIATGGNVRASLVANNCAWLQREFGLPSRLFRGHDVPGRPVSAEEVHGPYGLGDVQAPSAELPPMSSLLHALPASGGGLDLLVLGPATDAARLLAGRTTAGRVERVVLMGGAFEDRDGRRGNVTPHAEFNFYANPQAAAAVLTSGVACDVVPLDATESRLFTERELTRALGDSARAKFVRQAVRYLRAAQHRLGQGDGVYMHDVIAAAHWAGLLSLDWEPARITDVVGEGPRRGMVQYAAGRGPLRYGVGFDEAEFLRQWRQVAASL